ncbi:hypothetical protein A3758_16490 [Oleiphilus sp. HI0118]|nr:hypothetical protein A3758_04200 [Oleiphilus sp. HI0118]KZZ53374.1 hypothetical protein A3758_16490 [Oleiphilus sp. HI0118]KZZ79196.1 hypothetical protein A3767_17215 [Oleiphilus sp. HI0133]KZZ80895.1 hypothetical protein A3767_09185 [Oleiphilus sp. HI0133]
MTLNDLRLAALRAEGYGDHTNDAVNKWLSFATVKSGTTKDLWSELFDAAGIPDGQFNDRQHKWFLAQGAVGETLNEAEYNYWLNRAP